MVKRLSKQEIFSLILVLILIFLNNAVANMLIPSYTAIIEEFRIPEDIVALPDSSFILVSAGFALMWGYFTDKIDRARVIFIGALCWCLGSVVTAFARTYFQLFLARSVTGVGLGCVLPVGMSIISDIVPEEERSGYLGGVAILSSVSNAVGNSLSAFLGPLDIWGMAWRFPFFLIAVLSVFVVVLLVFIKIPKRGATEEELLALQEFHLEYNYQIDRKDLVEIFKKRTNRMIFIQGFFSIIPGTVLIYYLIRLLQDPMFAGLPEKISLQTATIFAGMVGIGYLVGNVVLSYLGDVFFKRNKANRVRLATISVFVTLPFCFLMLAMIQPIDAQAVINDLNIPVDPQTGEYVIPNDQVMQYVVAAIQSIFRHHPNYAWYFFLSLAGSFMSAGAVANRNATILDINLPEHRGTASSIFNLSEQVGKGITLLLAGALINWLGSSYRMMYVAFLLWIPAGLLWALALRSVVRDLDEKSIILSERKQMTLIDYIFELEIVMDGALQKVQDSKYFLATNVMRSEDLISEALKVFTDVHQIASERDMEDVAVRALKLKIKTSQLLEDLRRVVIQQRTGADVRSVYSDLAQIQMKIDEFPKSDLNKIEILYDSGFLKVCEARLERKRDDTKAMASLQQAIRIFQRVERLLRERLSDKDEDEPDYERMRYLLQKAMNSKENTIKLQRGLERLFQELREEGIDTEDLRKISELTTEYELDIKEIIKETLGEEAAKVFDAISEEIDQLFVDYDLWEQSHPRFPVAERAGKRRGST
ncbi:MAG: hypothetical protein Kow0069_19820 [Promethearchaeota archaeon]